jgi:hypothetical protein
MCVWSRYVPVLYNGVASQILAEGVLENINLGPGNVYVTRVLCTPEYIEPMLDKPGEP